MKVKMPAREDAAIDMAPMIDMVFLLLVFFMVASIAAEERVEIEALPHSSHAKVPEHAKNRMIVSVDKDGNLYSDMDEVELEDLEKIVEARVGANPDLRVLVRADERVRYKRSKELMMACGKAGATDLIYSAYEE